MSLVSTVVSGSLSPRHGSSPGGRPPVCKVAVKKPCKQSQTAEKKNSSPAWRLGEALTTPHRNNFSCYEPFTKASNLAQDRHRWRTLVKAVMNLRVPLNVGNFFTS